jgi:heme/copper-type cytochrome/quinol oxidase subunit 3
MALFITTEALLFVMLFFTYIYLAGGSLVWHDQEPPKLAMALTMLAILLVSSAVLHWGEKKLREEQPGSARIAVAATVALGVVFMVLQVLEYKDHLRKLTPQTNAYGSIFYTITSFHGLHLMFGLAMLLFVVVLPRYEPVRVPPHRAYHNAAMYWHFVDAIWVIVVALLYLAPNLART